MSLGLNDNQGRHDIDADIDIDQNTNSMFDTWKHSSSVMSVQNTGIPEDGGQNSFGYDI